MIVLFNGSIASTLKKKKIANNRCPAFNGMVIAGALILRVHFCKLHYCDMGLRSPILYWLFSFATCSWFYVNKWLTSSTAAWSVFVRLDANDTMFVAVFYKALSLKKSLSKCAQNMLWSNLHICIVWKTSIVCEVVHPFFNV